MDTKYQEYLASREWAEKREAVRKRSGNKCERCYLNPQQAVHHKTYANVYQEPLEDLMAICNPCHEFVSAKTGVDPVSDGVKVYLAGPITRNPWRNTLFAETLPSVEYWQNWPTSRKGLRGGFDCTGPWFLDIEPANHRDLTIEDGTHGQNVFMETRHGEEVRSEFVSRGVIASCCNAIRQANVIFAWVPHLEAFGTLWELGFATALNKNIFMMAPAAVSETIYDNLWFTIYGPTTSYGVAASADAAWDEFIAHWPTMRRYSCQ